MLRCTNTSLVKRKFILSILFEKGEEYFDSSQLPKKRALVVSRNRGFIVITLHFEKIFYVCFFIYLQVIDCDSKQIQNVFIIIQFTSKSI